LANEADSPFTPGLPVAVDLFVGRTAEVTRLKAKVEAAAKGRFQIAFLTGERGIGKSSLVSLLRVLVEREPGIVGLHAFVGGVGSLEELVRRVVDRLLNDSISAPAWHEKVRDLFGTKIQQVGMFGINVKFEAPKEELRSMVEHFSRVLRSFVSRLPDDKHGLLLILDDINGLAESEEFANWLKSLVDEIAVSHDPLPVFILLVGLEDRRQSLIGHQPSLARVFDLIDIRPWTPAEAEEFYTNAFGRVSIAVDSEALKALVYFAGGLPVLAHELGDAAFRRAVDGRIKEEAAWAAVFDAAEIVGRKHLQPQVFEAIRSEKYRRTLTRLAGGPLAFAFERKTVLASLPPDERKVFDNFLQRVGKLGVVTRDGDRGPGAYRFTNLLHYLYFRMQAQRVPALPKSQGETTS
jgi:hypothetical protein